MSKFKTVGRWWANKEIELIEIEGNIYALDRWNGEEYINCWKCEGEDHMEASEEKYIIRPIYKEIEGEYEIVDYKVL